MKPPPHREKTTFFFPSTLHLWYAGSHLWWQGLRCGLGHPQPHWASEEHVREPLTPWATTSTSRELWFTAGVGGGVRTCGSSQVTRMTTVHIASLLGLLSDHVAGPLGGSWAALPESWGQSGALLTCFSSLLVCWETQAWWSLLICRNWGGETRCCGSVMGAWRHAWL